MRAHAEIAEPTRIEIPPYALHNLARIRESIFSLYFSCMRRRVRRDGFRIRRKQYVFGARRET